MSNTISSSFQKENAAGVHFLPHAEYDIIVHNVSLTSDIQVFLFGSFFFSQGKLSAYLVLHIMLFCICVALCWEKEIKRIHTFFFVFLSMRGKRQKKLVTTWNLKKRKCEHRAESKLSKSQGLLLKITNTLFCNI